MDFGCVAVPALLRTAPTAMITLLERCLHALAVEPATVRLAVQEALSTLQPLYSPLPPEIAPALQALLDQAAGEVGHVLVRSRAHARLTLARCP